jgi:hypothetical protein
LAGPGAGVVALGFGAAVGAGRRAVVDRGADGAAEVGGGGAMPVAVEVVDSGTVDSPGVGPVARSRWFP